MKKSLSWAMNLWMAKFALQSLFKVRCAPLYLWLFDNVDVYCVIFQVVFLPGFGCLYIDVVYEGGTLVLSLAPEGSVDAVVNQHSRYVCTGSGFIVVVLCSLCIWTITNHPCTLFFITSRYLPFIVFTSNCFMNIGNSSVFMQQLFLDSKHGETGIVFTTGGQ